MAASPGLLLFSAILAVALFSAPAPTDAARVLGLFPHPGRTHFIVFEPLLRALAERGHEVVVVGHYPQKTPLPRYTDIDISGSHVDLAGQIDVANFDSNDGRNIQSGINDFIFITEYGLSSCDAILSHPAVKRLLASNDKFDLIINEAFNTNCFLGIVHHFRPAPYISMSSCMLMGWDWWRVGNLRSPAVFPNTFLWLTDEMTFGQRLLNTLFTLAVNTYKERVLDRAAEEIARKHFGPDMPPLKEIARNVSLVIVNSNPALNTPKALVPAIVEAGGLHIQPARPLPKDLEQFVAGAKHGVVMFSMGSMIRASSLPVENAAALLKALGTLKQRVVWKWEADPPGPLPKNVRMLKWLPQFDVLCHNNTRLFIGHGGLLSTSEAAYCGVPLLGIAMYGDQRTNLAAASKTGAARSIPYSTLKDTDLFLRHINDLLSEPSYHESAKILSERFRDRPMSPLDTAVYWTEYVIRHKGAPHLRGSARNLTWWQESLLDVIAVVLLGVAAVVVLLVAMLRSFIRLLCSALSCGKAAGTKQKKA